MIRFLKKEYFWVIIILLIAFVARLYKIDSPIADWHSWRQADTASVTRNFIKEGFNPLMPKGDDMSGIADYPTVNINRYRFVEFPIYNIAVYPLYLIFGIYDLYHRLVSVLFSLGSIVFLYLLIKKYLGKVTSLLTVAIYSLLPFNIFFSRTTLPEPTFLFFSLGMMYFIDNWIWNDKLKWGFLGLIFTSIAFLIKPWAIFFVPPLIYSLVSKSTSSKNLKKFLFFAIISLIPFILWRFWILQQPEGIPASGWLLNGDHIRFRPAFWWWLVSERMGREILGVSGFVLFIIGVIKKPKDGSYFMHIWLLSFFAYFIIFATGNIRHNYYQYIFVPIASIFLTKGFLYLASGIEGFVPRFWTIILAAIFLPLTFYSTWIQVREFYKVNNPAIINAGRLADKILPKNAIVAAPYNGDTAFLYQINRIGWPFIPISITNLIADYGVEYYISTTRDNKTNWVLKHFQVLEDNPQFIIADLTKVRESFDKDPEP